MKMTKNEMKTTPFELTFRRGGNTQDLAFWIHCFDEDYTIHARVLFSSLTEKSGQLFGADSWNEDDRNYTSIINIYYEVDYGIVMWIISKEGSNDIMKYYFTVYDYFATIKCNFDTFHNSLEHGEICLNTDCTSKEIGYYCEQFTTAIIPALNPYSFYLKDTTVEKLQFTCNYGFFDMPYQLQIGNRAYNSYMSDWSTSLPVIRHALEQLVYCGESTIHLRYENDPTEISISRCSILRSKKKVDKGTFYDWAHYCFVKVIPDSFCKAPILVGVCNPTQVLKELYDGLLNVCRMPFRDSETDYDTWDDMDNLTFYNQIKSPIIERKICAKEKEAYTSNSTPQIRQVDIKEIITVNTEEVRSYSKDALLNQEKCLQAVQKMRNELADEYDLWYEDTHDADVHNTTRPILIYKTYKRKSIEDISH
jgi:hypothetical protein